MLIVQDYGVKLKYFVHRLLTSKAICKYMAHVLMSIESELLLLIPPFCAGTLSSESTSTSSLSAVMKQFQEIIQTTDRRLSEAYLLLAVSYITQSLFQHYHLYQFLLCEEQPLELTLLDASVEVADCPQPLCGGLTEQEYERREKIKVLQAAHMKKEQEYLSERQLALQEEEEKLTEAYTSQFTKLQDSSHLVESDVTDVINSLATAHMHSVLTTVTQDVKKQGLDIGLKVDRLGILASKPVEEDPKSPSPRKDTSMTPRGGRRSRPGKS